MKLHTLSLTNFRAFKTLEISFESDLTVLVGANGSGKTSVLDAIVRVVSPFSPAEQCPVTIDDFLLNETSQEMSASFADDQTRVGAIQIHSAVMGDNVQSRKTIEPGLKQNKHRMPLVLVYPVNRQVRDSTPGGLVGGDWGRRELAWKEWFEASKSYDAFFAWFKELEDLENEQFRFEGARENPQLSAARRALRVALQDATEIRVRRQMPPLRYRPFLSLKKQGQVFPFDMLSEGERTTIAMIADIARRLAIYWPNAADPLQQEALVLIDEIEQHIHPGWQRHLMGALLQVFPNVQFIVTTHSPVIVSEVEARQLRVLKDFQLVQVDHGEGRDANAVLEDTFETPSRSQEIQEQLERLGDLVDDGEHDAAAKLLGALEERIGATDPDLTFYRNILMRLRAK